MSELGEATVPSLDGLNSPLNFVLFYHSVLSDWNNGNAHYLRGIVKELVLRSHHVTVYEPHDAWSVQNLAAQSSGNIETAFKQAFPEIEFVRYNPALLQLDEVLEQANVVIVHEWNEHSLVADIGRHHQIHQDYTLLFHDTHHRSVTDPDAMQAYDLKHYDGVLAFGNVVRDLYLEKGWAERAWTWHEAADTTIFYPRPAQDLTADILWIGNWGDEERTAELHDYFFGPVKRLNLSGSAFGVRYPEGALEVLRDSGIQYGGWVPNQQVPELASRHRMMIHVPRRPYVEALPGIPTIRPFEALACGIPLVSSYWDDAEGMFTTGRDFLMAQTPAQMEENMLTVQNDARLREDLVAHGLNTIRARHTCAHRVDELMQILHELSPVKNVRD